VTLLHVVPALIDKLLQTIDPDTLRQSLSSVRLIVTGATALSDHTALTVRQLLPTVQLLQGKYRVVRKNRPPWFYFAITFISVHRF